MGEITDERFAGGEEPGIPEAEGAAEVEVLPRKRWRRGALAVSGLILLSLAYAWSTREDIAKDVIAGQLDRYGLRASYRIESFSTRRQVIRDVVIGDPANPDLTVERAEVSLVPTFGVPKIGWVKLVKPRLYGTWRDGRLSFGTLDKLIYDQEKKEPFALPDLRLILDDGRALLRLPQGQVGIKAEGRGRLNDGFKGVVAAVAPAFDLGDCTGGRTTLYGTLAVEAGQPHFQGPVRTDGGRCADGTLSFASSALQLDAELDEDMAGGSMSGKLAAGAIGFSGGRITRTSGTVHATFRDGRLTGRHALASTGVATEPLRITNLALSGTIRARDGFSTFEWQSDAEGKGLRTGGGIERGLASLQRSTEGTLLAPLLAQARAGLARESGNGELNASFTMRRRAGEQLSLVVPQAALRGRSGATLLNISRLQASIGPHGLAGLSGNFVTGGGGLPHITGRMEQGMPGTATFRLSMPEYRTGDSSLALPDLLLVQRAGGGVGFAGRLTANGAIPGGQVKGLELPLSGYLANGGFVFGERCVDVRFQSAEVAGFTTGRNSLSFCPTGQRPMLRSGVAGMRLAARMPAFDLPGRLGGSRARLRSAGATIASPGRTTVRGLELLLGEPGNLTRLATAELDAELGGGLQGRFHGAEASIAAVPLDIREAQGLWRWGDGGLRVSDASFVVNDRQRDARFEPLVSNDGQLALDGNDITAQATLSEPATQRAVVRVAVVHDLGTGDGRADLNMAGLLFDKDLQPEMLSRRLLGVVANVAGTVTGTGEIVWNGGQVTSRGDVSTRSLDLAAAFGPAKGVSGTVHFTDLLGMTTAPGQVLRVESMNPGIEVLGGEIRFDLSQGQVLALRGAEWPFLGGTLRMDPTSLRVGVSETRRYVMHLRGVDAAQFVQRMELGNINATGIFDGQIPIVFDEKGGRLDGGELVSRPPGGNVAYVGELTYQDLSPMANFAFASLRSLDYRQMHIRLDGPLTGEIVTRISFEGVTQGEGTKQNFLTKKIAKLPVRFNVNIRAPFYQLITSIKAMYDPALIRDPRDIGLMDADGNIIENPQIDPLKLLDARRATPAAPGVQPSESEKMR